MILLMVCLALIAAALVLGSRNVRLKKELGSHTIRSADQVELEGVTFEAMTFRDSAGGPAELAFGRKGVLLLVFASNCPDCVATLPDWEELFVGDGSIKPDLMPVYGIQLDMPEAGQTRSDAGMAKELPFPILGAADENTLRELRRIAIIPAAIVMDADGTVVQTWIGRPTDEILEEISAWIAG